MNICPECGATHADNQTCNDDFNTLLGWETEDPDKWEVHHLMVLAYHLQHPTIYSQEGLEGAINLLAEFTETKITPDEVRKREKDRLNSNRRRFKITSTSDSRGTYAHPVKWNKTASDVVASGPEDYVKNVKAWARSIYDILKAADNLAPKEEAPRRQPGRPTGRPATRPTGRPTNKSGEPLKPLGKHWKPRHKN